MTLALSVRRKRWIKITSSRWQRRAIFLLGGVGVGAAAVALAQLAALAQVAFALLLSKSRYVSLVVTPLGFALAVFVTNRFFPNSQGSGIPQAIAARHLTDHKARESLVSLRIAFGKIILTLFGLLCGASVGREGPTVQIGASIMFALGRFSPRRQPGLILAGAAGGRGARLHSDPGRPRGGGFGWRIVQPHPDRGRAGFRQSAWARDQALPDLFRCALRPRC